MTEQGHDGEEGPGRIFTVRIRASWARTALVVLVTAAVVAPLAAYAADRFTDVPSSNIFHDDISWLADADVTKGCNPPDNTEFCPGENVTREQMAAFMRRLAENRVVDADTVDGQHASAFLGTSQQAADSALLDGQDLNEVRYPTVLPDGETIVGHFGVDDDAVNGDEIIGANVDYGIDVGARPTKVYVPTGSSDPNCTGEPGNPTAPPGFLCVYEQYENNANFREFGDGLAVSARFGDVIAFDPDAAGDLIVGGTWAVTAPTTPTAPSFSPPSDDAASSRP